MKIKPIKHVDDMYNNIKNLKGSNYVFRGECKYVDGQYKNIQPAIFRRVNQEGKYDIQGAKTYSENELIDAVLNKFPSEFTETKNNMDVLLKMQHYEIPTRLLDVTFNPYIALFFALNESSKGGYVYVINTNEMVEKNIYSTDLVYLSAFSRLTQKDRQELEKLIMMYCLARYQIHIVCAAVASKKRVQISEAHRKLLKVRDIASFEVKCEALIEPYINDNDNKMAPLSALNNFKNIQKILLDCRAYVPDIELDSFFIDSVSEPWIKEWSKGDEVSQILEVLEYVLADCVEKMPIMEKILNKIRYYNPGFQKRPDFRVYFNTYLIRSYSSNARISNQQGGFILLSPFAENDVLSTEYIEEVWEIAQEVKDEILDTLDKMNINKNFIFPELQNFEHKKYLKE